MTDAKQIFPKLVPISLDNEIYAHITNYGDSVPNIYCEKCNKWKVTLQASTVWNFEKNHQLSVVEVEKCNCYKVKEGK